ncbi:dethiobiotin synthase [Actinomycetospora straminea]|uniref:ATP-dependent dethiobiotin synthetase BioD n=1 Tax=Actinomycetospora straminea TaxID=663607 RepID=A0ABP9F2N6_9PSEU|nr:dethiobiotin synthase [Actinomycetospora straminea]MDD7932870.1 dethiobiotin synthase [Actinomycetospora straminea]
MRILVVTGTGTDVGKTVVVAAIAALARAAGERVTVVKPAQTGVAPGEDGDLAAVAGLAGPVGAVELARYPEPLAPATAARCAGTPPVMAAEVVDAVRAQDADLVIVEGAGGLLVRFNDLAETLADVAAGLAAPVVLVASAGLGVLNTAALTAEALARRGLTLAGTVVGAYPEHPDLAERTNLDDLPTVTAAPLLGVLPAGLGAASPEDLLAAARCGLGPVLGGGWSPRRAP